MVYLNAATSTYTDAHTYSYAYTNTDAYTHAYTDSNTNADAHTDTERGCSPIRRC